MANYLQNRLIDQWHVGNNKKSLTSRWAPKPKSRAFGRTSARLSLPRKQPEWRWYLRTRTKPDNPIIFAKTGTGHQGTPALRSIAHSIGTRSRLVVQPPSFCDRGVFRNREGERPCGAMHDHREGTDIWSPAKSVTGTVVVTWAIPIGVRR
jgi:hypothetical protein